MLQDARGSLRHLFDRVLHRDARGVLRRLVDRVVYRDARGNFHHLVDSVCDHAARFAVRPICPTVLDLITVDDVQSKNVPDSGRKPFIVHD